MTVPIAIIRHTHQAEAVLRILPDQGHQARVAMGARPRSALPNQDVPGDAGTTGSSLPIQCDLTPRLLVLGGYADGVDNMTAGRSRSECHLHGDEGREPWGAPFRGIEVVRCDHLGSAYVVEMVLLAGGEAKDLRSHHIHFVRGSAREVHALDERLSQERVDRVWRGVVAAMERGDRPRAHEARFHARDE